ncbi:MAG: FHA domain-containing protein [Candidatus Omnitrophica bacterium]|nr:FHA domain-containing protein [Candidatus Omnitrophota bacterium]
MVLLRVLSGKKSGQNLVARRFPCRIGRENGAELQLDDPGVWDRHLELDLNPSEGFVLAVLGNALATLNGHDFQRAVLHNGDLIQIGSAKMTFRLSETRQRDLQWREGLTWFFIAGLSLCQIALVYWLIR